MSFTNPDSIVVVPWDFSDHSRRALDYTLDLVDADQIRVVHVARLPVMVGAGIPVQNTSEAAVKENSEAKFREIVADDPRCAAISYTVLVRDELGYSICDFACDENAELIVISTHGRTGLSRLMIGSVAERVIRCASCPVLVLRREPDQ